MVLLERIDYKKLLENDTAEAARLDEVCRTVGIFQLDMSSEEVFTALPTIYDAATECFAQPHDVKILHCRDGVERGFKQYGQSATFEFGLEDRDSSFPEPLRGVKLELSKVARSCDLACRVVLSCLQKGLSLNQLQSSLKLCYRNASNNGEQVESAAHTDSGILTLLFYDQSTLETMIDESIGWQSVTPRAGCVVVNVADALQDASSGCLQSPLHRVIQPSGPCKERLSAVHFLRPVE